MAQAAVNCGKRHHHVAQWQAIQSGFWIELGTRQGNICEEKVGEKVGKGGRAGRGRGIKLSRTIFRCDISSLLHLHLMILSF